MPTATPDRADSPSLTDRGVCVSCGGSRRTRVLSAKKAARDARLDLFECAECELVYAGWWKHEFAHDLYNYFERRAHFTREQEYVPINVERTRDIFIDLETRVSGRRHLDVGCGNGLQAFAASELGWDTLGIDLSDAAIAMCQRFGVNARKLDLFSPTLSERSYDLVTMVEFIEHVPNPGRFLARARDLVHDDGLIRLTTPNFDCIARRLLGVDWRMIHHQHLSYFTPSSLRKLAEANGLEVVSLESVNFSPTTFVDAARTLRLRVTGQEDASRTTGAPAKLTPTRGNLLSDRGLRAAIRKSPLLSAIQGSTNRALSRAGIGDSLVALLKPVRGQEAPQAPDLSFVTLNEWKRAI